MELLYLQQYVSKFQLLLAGWQHWRQLWPALHASLGFQEHLLSHCAKQDAEPNGLGV